MVVEDSEADDTADSAEDDVVESVPAAAPLKVATGVPVAAVALEGADTAAACGTDAPEAA